MKFFWRQGIFSSILILKLGVKMNLRIIMKNHAPDPEIRFLTKSISKLCGRATTIPSSWELNQNLKKKNKI